MATKRKHKNTPRITAAERVDAYYRKFHESFGGPVDLHRYEEKRAYMLKMLAAHARDTLDRHKLREARK